jgi:capsule polysaccharide modification protein KpsS
VNNIGDIAGKNILFLQGPVGLFFKKVGKQFQARGATIHRIGLNAGDAFFHLLAIIPPTEVNLKIGLYLFQTFYPLKK